MTDALTELDHETISTPFWLDVCLLYILWTRPAYPARSEDGPAVHPTPRRAVRKAHPCLVQRYLRRGLECSKAGVSVLIVSVRMLDR